MIKVLILWSSFRRSMTVLLAILALSGVLIGEVKAKSSQVSTDKTAAETAGVMSGINEEVVEDISGPTPEYAKKQQETAAYKEVLKEKGCQEINIDFCAGFLYSRNKSDGFKYPGTYDLWQKTILGDYVTDEQIYEFGRTNKGLDVVYFKDEKGKKTKEPAIVYVVTPDVRKFRISDIEKGIAFWEKVAPGFLRAMVANDVRVLFQGQASSNNKIKAFHFEYGIIYYNYSSSDTALFSFFLRKGLVAEMFGMKADALGIYSKDEIGVIKSWLARDCAYNILIKTGNKDVKNQLREFQGDLDRYMSSGNFTYEYMAQIIETIKKEGLMTPFGAKTWEEIDSINK